MATQILDLFETSGDTNVGQTLIRLARLAESAHRFDTAASLLGSRIEENGPVEGLDLRPVGEQPCFDDAFSVGRDLAHKEVCR